MRRWIDSDRAHHAFVFVFQKMAMIDEGSHRIRVAKVHAQANAGIGERASVEVGHVHGVAQKILIDRLAHVIEQQKMQLMNVKGMQFAGSVFDNPILYSSLLRNDFGVSEFMSNIFGSCPSTVR